MSADGTWGCFIAINQGENEIEITAHTDDGASATKTLKLQYQSSAPPYEIPVSLAREQGTKLLLKREGHKVFHARSTEAIEYARCDAAEPSTAAGGVVWEEIPDADRRPAAPRR